MMINEQTCETLKKMKLTAMADELMNQLISGAAIFAHAGKFDGVNMLVIPAFAEFDAGHQPG